MKCAKSENTLLVCPFPFIHPSDRFSSNHHCVLRGLEKLHHTQGKFLLQLFQRRLDCSQKLHILKYSSGHWAECLRSHESLSRRTTISSFSPVSLTIWDKINFPKDEKLHLDTTSLGMTLHCLSPDSLQKPLFN